MFPCVTPNSSSSHAVSSVTEALHCSAQLFKGQMHPLRFDCRPRLMLTAQCCWASSPSCRAELLSWQAAQKSTWLSVGKKVAPELLSRNLTSPPDPFPAMWANTTKYPWPLYLLRGGCVPHSQGCAHSPLKMKSALEVLIIWSKCSFTCWLSFISQGLKTLLGS